MTIDQDKVPFSYIIGYKDSDPMHLLYEITEYLCIEGREEPEFNMSEVNLHTMTRLDGKAQPLIEDLIEKNIIAKAKHSRYTIVSNPFIK